MSGEESKIVPIKEGSWNLRSVLVMLEGSNTHMLEYIKAKPRWRPSFGKANDAASEEVLAFKQILPQQGGYVLPQVTCEESR